jgi:excisionase family DNA binding protein
MPDITRPDRLISVQATCDIIGCKKTKYYQLVKEGKIRPIKVGRSTRNSENESHELVEAWKAAREVI